MINFWSALQQLTMAAITFFLRGFGAMELLATPNGLGCTYAQASGQSARIRAKSERARTGPWEFKKDC